MKTVNNNTNFNYKILKKNKTLKDLKFIEANINNCTLETHTKNSKKINQN